MGALLQRKEMEGKKVKVKEVKVKEMKVKSVKESKKGSNRKRIGSVATKVATLSGLNTA
jgi:hypothetical protein